MKRAVLITLILGAIGLAFFGLRKAVEPKQLTGVSSPSVYHPSPTSGNREPNPVLFFTAHYRDNHVGIQAVELSGTSVVSGSRVESDKLSALPDDTLSLQQTDPDHIFYIAPDSANRTNAFLRLRTDGNWRTLDGPLLQESTGPWGTEPIRWFSVAPPGPYSAKWSAWYISSNRKGSHLQFVTSNDGRSWITGDELIYEPRPKETIKAISVVPYGDGLRAWIVQSSGPANSAHLVTVAVDPANGRVIGLPDPVAWQSPRDWHEGLPKDNIPIIDACADHLPDNPRHVRLYITYKGPDGKSRITVAENFLVNGIYIPTVFSRQVQPIVEP